MFSFVPIITHEKQMRTLLLHFFHEVPNCSDSEPTQSYQTVWSSIWPRQSLFIHAAGAGPATCAVYSTLRNAQLIEYYVLIYVDWAQW